MSWEAPSRWHEPHLDDDEIDAEVANSDDFLILGLGPVATGAIIGVAVAVVGIVSALAAWG